MVTASIVIPTRTLDAIRPPSNDERMAQWAARYFMAGYHRAPRSEAEFYAAEQCAMAAVDMMEGVK